jgi:glycosyltransferase involved in cell wall biosynthesis
MVQERVSRISVIVPAFNAERTLKACLSSLLANRSDYSEIMVIDDRSTDATAEIARELGVRVIPNSRRKGPAGARNEGATHASGEILFFIDSDITVPDTILSEVMENFDREPELVALFGSYDTSPAQPNFLSQYKNLMHHFVHQISREETSSFWAGCGAIRKDIFLALGGFNDRDYPNASIEDIELGLRLSKLRHRIKLLKSIQVKHHKKWTIFNLLKADILYRAVPWTKLIAQSGKVPDDLNLQISQRWSAVLAGFFFLVCCLMAVSYWWHPIPLPILVTITALPAGLLIYLNRGFYRFLFRERGSFFLIPAFFWHVSYYLYSSITFVLLWIYHRMRMKLASGHPEHQTRTAG